MLCSMKSRRAAAAAALLLLSAIALSAEDFGRTFSIAKPPAWVKEDAGAFKETAAKNGESEICLLADYQENVAEEEFYVRIASRLLTSEGVQDGSTIMVNYDPSYQTLIFHYIRVVRGKQTSSRLSREAVNLLRRETDIEWSMIDGSVTASTVLKDVRPGDIVDYAYTVRGRNPVLGGKFSDSFSIGWGIGVARERVRILCPAGRKLQYRTVGAEAEPSVTSAKGVVEYLWELSDLAPVLDEDLTPSWHVSYPWIEISEFADWAAVRKWALPLYPPAALPKGIKTLTSEWGRSATAAQKLEAALDYVQQEIRYVGVELGEGSHKPRSPAVVYAQRFGDCKDKTYLLCSILADMGVKAYPVLVNTYARASVADFLPSPYNFNHVIAAVAVGDERVFVDPTDAYQRGPVLQRFVPDYGYGLAVASGEEDLVKFGGHQGRPPDVEMTEKFISAGREEPAELTVETRASGRAADDLRAEFAANSTAEMAKSYLDYYAASYPAIESAGDLDVRDDTNRNEFTVVEKYRIPGFWTLQEDEQAYTAEFFADAVYDQIPMPRTKIRTSPFALEHPNRVRERIEVSLPEPWPDVSEKDTVTTAAFTLTAECTTKDTLVVLDYLYESLAESVPVSEVRAYNEKVQNIDEILGYSLTWPVDDAGKKAAPAAISDGSGIDASVLMIMVLCALLLAVGSWGAYRFAVKPSGTAAPAQGQGGPETGARMDAQAPLVAPVSPSAPAPRFGELSGLGGWLILVAAQLFLNPVIALRNIWSSRDMYSVSRWYALTNPASADYNAVWWPYLLFQIVVNLAVVAAAVPGIVLFFQKRRRFPAFYIAFLILLAFSALGAMLFGRALGAAEGAGPDFARAIATAGVALAVWLPYILTSRRVKNTFVR